MVHEIEHFFGVYLLYNVNPKFKGRTYIGYTCDPVRRIKQHNLGKHAGGAQRTSGKGPWEMVLIIHGFPNMISGLRFEWAWQHPEKSRRLKHLPKKKTRELQFDHKFRIVSEMLRTAPWNRLALTIRWLKQEFSRDFLPHLAPPLHMAVAYGLVKIKKIKPTKKSGKQSKAKEDSVNESEVDDDLTVPSSRHTRCAVCIKPVKVSDAECVGCYHPSCRMLSHILCLSKHFLSASQRDITPGATHQTREVTHILPVEGDCPRCRKPLLWGEVIRHKHGCYQNLEEVSEDNESNDDHWANDLQTQVT